MRKLYGWVVNHCKSILTVFLLAAICGLLLKSMVAVNYDMNDYLPEDSHSTISLDVMQEEFDGGIPNARVMVRDVTIPEALEYKARLEAVDGVTAVTWLDDALDITVPLSFAETDTIETYYKDNTALFSVTIEEESRISAVSDIREIIGDENAMTGSAVSTASATVNTVSEIRKIAIIAVIFVLIVLLLTTNSWLEPLVILAGLGVAIAINGGSNLIFGEISFVTNAAGSILQLAVSLDYSVFLIHRFEECRGEKQNVKEAMVEALCKSTSSILSSGLTTVIGFLALVLMQFRIGPDLGLALAKGVAISLITVFVFMPALVLTVYKLLDQTRHKKLLPGFHRFGKVVRRIAIPMVCLFAVLIVPAYTYYKNKNIDIRRGALVLITAFLGTIVGSYCGYLFSQSQPDGLGYLSMLTTIFLGIKFLFKPVTGGKETSANYSGRKESAKTRLAMVLGCLIGWVCGFTGSGGGILMLTVFTLVLGYNLKIAVGTSTMIMSAVALTGTVSHISMGAKVNHHLFMRGAGGHSVTNQPGGIYNRYHCHIGVCVPG